MKKRKVSITYFLLTFMTACLLFSCFSWEATVIIYNENTNPITSLEHDFSSFTYFPDLPANQGQKVTINYVSGGDIDLRVDVYSNSTLIYEIFIQNPGIHEYVYRGDGTFCKK